MESSVLALVFISCLENPKGLLTGSCPQSDHLPIHPRADPHQRDSTSLGTSGPGNKVTNNWNVHFRSPKEHHSCSLGHMCFEALALKPASPGALHPIMILSRHDQDSSLKSGLSPHLPKLCRGSRQQCSPHCRSHLPPCSEGIFREAST